MRRHGGKLLAGERAGDELDARIDLRQVDADVAAQHRQRQPRGAGLVGIGHGGVGMLLDRERLRPAVLDRIAEAVQRADAGIAAPGEHDLVDAAHADELVVDQVGRHADQRQALLLLADDLVAGGMRDQVGEPLHGHGVAIADGRFHGLGKRQKTRHGTVRWLAADYLRGRFGGVKCLTCAPDAVQSNPTCSPTAARVRIEWGQCDPAGIVFYPHYFAMFDHSTVLLIERALGMKKHAQRALRARRLSVGRDEGALSPSHPLWRRR